MRILIADDHALMRDALKSLLESHGLSVVGEAQNGAEAIALARDLAPDVVLMDLSMPGVDGLTATRAISSEMPQIPVVILTASEEDGNLFEAIKAGAQGYLLKNLESKEFFTLLERIEHGEPALTPYLAKKLLQEFALAPHGATRTGGGPDPLTEREVEVLTLLVEGVTSNRKLSHHLGVSGNTIKFHIRNILDKLHLHDRAQAVSYALRHGIGGPPAG